MCSWNWVYYISSIVLCHVKFKGASLVLNCFALSTPKWSTDNIEQWAAINENKFHWAVFEAIESLTYISIDSDDDIIPTAFKCFLDLECDNKSNHLSRISDLQYLHLALDEFVSNSRNQPLNSLSTSHSLRNF